MALKSIKDTNVVGSGCVIRGCGGHLVAASSAPIPKAGDSLWMLAQSVISFQLYMSRFGSLLPTSNSQLLSLLPTSNSQLLSLLKFKMRPLEINELL